MNNKYFSVILGLMIATIAFLFIKEQKEPENKNSYSSAAPVASTNIFGVMTDDTSLTAKLFAIQSLGLSATRETVLTSTWKGKSARCEFWNRNNIQMYLNINSQPQGKGYEFPNDSIEIADYAHKMAQIATLYKPYFIFVENEELNSAYHEGNLFGDYTRLLQVAIDSAHANNFKIGGGGFTSKQIVRLTYRSLWQTNDSAAAYFLTNCVPVDDTAWLSNYMTDKKQEENLSTNAALLRWYANTNVDAVNVHLYLPFRNRTKGTLSAKGNGTTGLVYVIAYLNSVLDGKKIISNEVGFVENNADLSYNTFRILDSAGVEVCFYGGQGSKRFVRNELPTKLGTGIKSYKP